MQIMNTHRQTLAFAASLAGAICLAGCSQGLKPGTMAPDFQLADMDQNSVSLSDYRGQVVLLGFWAVR